MANLQIIDTGYLRADIIGSVQATQANSGSAITLKAVDINFQYGGNVDTEPRVNTNSIPIINFGSVGASKITINGVLDRTSTTDMNLMDALRDLVHTYGVKLLSYSDTTDGYRDVTDSLGGANEDDWHKTSFYSSTTTPHLHVKVINFTIKQQSSSHLRYTLECVETA